MSAGYSSSNGSDTSRQTSVGSSKGQNQSTTANNQGTTFDNTSTTNTAVPAWAKEGNKSLFDSRSADTQNANDFLTGLLTDPEDSSAPQNRYSTALENLFKTNLTQARSGDAQSIGVGKQGQREGAALSDAETSAINTGTSAANSLLANDNPNSNLDFARLFSPTTQTSTGGGTTTGLSTTNSSSNQNTTGDQNSVGSSDGSNVGGGITLCCFIFLAHYRGRPLPPFVRRCRDEFATGPRVSGYRRMSKTLVSAMLKSMLVSSIVSIFMIRPLEWFGGWLYNEPGCKRGWLAAPVVGFWFSVWSWMGKEGK